ncbi:unnamed protein product [Bursaphelenchus xylophilus]|uniref:(pine wood nematode) hypothetical protein n=1 Tax=Bursaphelenchus xylophilus TaxID=6326 RepID=A0A1I7S9A7_BURXY|nr:unnamed protein product [Bursaphelenchus xylophilus]CAG9100483.1 unnamed protein product [Bursaphelenchus xylophilus]
MRSKMKPIKIEPQDAQEVTEVTQSEKKRRGHYTVLDDLELIRYFLEKHRAGDVEAQRKQSRKLWEPLIEEKKWTRQPSAVESHFRKNVIKKLFDFDLPAEDVFLLAYHFDVAMGSVEKASLEARYNCRIETNSFGVFCGAFGKNGEPLHQNGLQDKGVSSEIKGAPVRRRRPKPDLDSSVQITAKRPRPENTSDIVSVVSIPEIKVEEGAEGTSKNATTEEIFASIKDVLDRINLDTQPLDRSGPMKTPIGGSSVYERTKRALNDRLVAVVNGRLQPGMLDDLPIFQKAKGCSGMIKMLTEILTTVITGSEDDLKNFDKTHGLSSSSPRKSPVTSTPLRRPKSAMRQLDELFDVERPGINVDGLFVDLRSENGQERQDKITLNDMKNAQEVSLNASAEEVRMNVSTDLNDLVIDEGPEAMETAAAAPVEENDNPHPKDSEKKSVDESKSRREITFDNEDLFVSMELEETRFSLDPTSLDNNALVRAPTSNAQRPPAELLLRLLHGMSTKSNSSQVH